MGNVKTRRKLGNGRTAIIRVHTSKRGHTYKRRTIVVSDISVPSWWRR